MFLSVDAYPSRCCTVAVRYLLCCGDAASRTRVQTVVLATFGPSGYISVQVVECWLACSCTSYIIGVRRSLVLTHPRPLCLRRSAHHARVYIPIEYAFQNADGEDTPYLRGPGSDISNIKCVIATSRLSLFHLRIIGAGVPSVTWTRTSRNGQPGIPLLFRCLLRTELCLWLANMLTTELNVLFPLLVIML
jgi:hypothetical protein